MAAATPCNVTNYFGLTQYDYQCSFFDGVPPLPQWLGWFILAVFGAMFSLVTSAMLWVDWRFAGTQKTSEHFNTAGRSILAGLTACDIVSKWTWAATLLQSSNVAYKFGISGPFWYASGATIQILLFAILAVEVKRKAPTAHTVLEIVDVRWGGLCHKVFFVFCILTNIIVTSMLILGGSAVVEALTGVNLYAAAFLIPVGVMFYTAHGGLKATYLAAWFHVAVVYIALNIFTFLVYASDKYPIGSPSKVWNNLNVVASITPVPDNKGGSFMTMFSRSGLIFGIINIIGNFGTVFVDQAYWMCAIAAKPEATYKGYILGGMCWFAIPFAMATAMGLGARAMGLPISLDESNAGLVPPAVATALMGQGGAFLVVFQLWMAVTASGSAEQIAVATLVSYDLYKKYINPKATGKQIIFVSRIMVLVYGVLSGVLAIILQEIGLSLGWVYLFMGVVIGSAVAPIYLSITWKDATANGAIAGAVVGLVCAVITWTVTAQCLEGEVTVDTLGMDYPMLAGNLVSICVSAIVCVVVSMIKPQNYDWAEMRSIQLIEDDPNARDLPSQERLTRVLKWTYVTGGVLTIVLLVLWPLLTLPAGVFSESYFTFWVSLAMAWGLLAGMVCFFFPVWEARHVIVKVLFCDPTKPDLGVEAPTLAELEAEDLKAANKTADVETAVKTADVETAVKPAEPPAPTDSAPSATAA